MIISPKVVYCEGPWSYAVYIPKWPNDFDQEKLFKITFCVWLQFYFFHEFICQNCDWDDEGMHGHGANYFHCKFLIYCNSIPGGPQKRNSRYSRFFQDFALINSHIFSPCWIKHLFLIIITPRSSDWELFILWVIYYGLSFSGFARFSRVPRPRLMTMANPENDSP